MASKSYSADDVRAARQRLLDAGFGADSPAPRTLGVPEPIERSWRRTLSQSASQDATAAPAGRPLAKSSDRLVSAATGVLDHWTDSLVDMRIALFVSDRSGQIIARRVSERSHARQLDRAHAAEGFDFSEASLGTNGLGTAMEERSALFVRGAEHVNGSLQTLACAGAPICDPISGRVIGSIALASPIGSSDPTMLAIARQAARQVEASIADTARSDGLHALLTEFAGTSARIPVIALSRAGMLSTTGALPLLSAASHVMLWDQLQSHDWSGQRQNVLVSGRAGSARRVLDGRGESVYIVEFETELDTADVPDAHQPTTFGLFERLDELSARTATISITGPDGAGKSHLAAAWVTRRGGLAPAMFEASDARRPAVRRRVQESLRAGRSVLVRHIERLGEDDVHWLQTLLRTADPGAHARLIVTLEGSQAPQSIRTLVSRLAMDVNVPALSESPERIVAVAHEVAEELGITLSPSILQSLIRWNWPGNVAELRDVLTRAAFGSSNGTLEAGALPVEMRAHARQLYGLADYEYRAIDAALRAAGGNRSRAAASLGIGRTTLYRKMRAYGFDGAPTLAD